MESSILSLMILIFIYIHAYNRLEKVFTQYRLFIALVQMNIVLIVVDILSWHFNGLPGLANMICNKGFNLLLYIIEPMGAVLSILYTNFQVYQDDCRVRKQRNALIFPLVINAVISIMSLQTGWIFSVDAENIYHRGDFFGGHALFCCGLLIYSFVFVILNRSALEKKCFYALLFYFVPQAAGTAIQLFNYGVSFNWTGMMLSLLIIYLNIQDRRLHTDYLTGLYNRRQLDSYIQTNIQNCTLKKSFSAILIDLDDFKLINDRFGHKVGDEALQSVVKIIKKCVSIDDFVARYGGDEFFIILKIDDYQLLEQAVNKIREGFEGFNKIGQKPYQIKLSFGYDIYNYQSKMKTDEFFKHVDTLMYNNKRCTK